MKNETEIETHNCFSKRCENNYNYLLQVNRIKRVNRGKEIK